MNGRCVIVGGADIGNYGRIRSYLRDDDFLIYCDSGLRHMEGLGMAPSLIVGDFDSHENPHMDIETIVLPVAKDDTDTVYAIREGRNRGYTDFLLLGVFGARMDHTLVNVYALLDLHERGCTAMAVDDYSEILIIGGSHNNYEGENNDRDGVINGDNSNNSGLICARIDDSYPFFSLIALDGDVHGVTIRGAKFELDNADITSRYQYATSNEVIPSMTAEVTVREGRLLLIRILKA